jgi:HSP20 family protein
MNKQFKFPFWNQELEQLVDDFVKSMQTENTKDFGWSWTRPLANIEEFADHYLIALAAPGLHKSDFKISVEQQNLKVEVDKPRAEVESNKRKTEFNYHSFSRHFKLSDDVHIEGISGQYENGILTITLPKKTEATGGPKTITIQ